jgi:hypothetical protein
MRALWLAIAAINPACLRGTEFHCTTAGECGGNGRCEPQGYCSFPDSACDGYRFAESAGPLAGQCVGASGDAGVDTPVIDGPPVDGPLAAGCPALYNELPGGSPHRYRLLTQNESWQTQRDFCAITSSSAYLAIPDDLPELMALSTLTGGNNPYWIGIHDMVTEGTFVTVRGQPAMFLPWTAGAPDDDPPGEDCVTALAATQLYNDDRCNTKLPAICECEP